MKSKTILHTLLTFMLVFGSTSTVYAATPDTSTSNGPDNRQLIKDKIQLIKQLRERRQREPEHKKLYRSALPIVEETASLLGITKDDLIAELKKDKSLNEVAKSRGMSGEELAGKLMVLRIQKINEAVIAGKLPAEKAEKIKSRMKEHVAYLLNQKGSKVLEHIDTHKWLRHNTLRHFTPSKMAELIGISEQELVGKLKSGHSLSEIAEEQGISRQELTSRIKGEADPIIERMLDKKLIPQDKSKSP
ncbi:hypothetical protein [Paenibacillus senegalensis]|uniref:hypothetical protein n=1 Tax=Paenibacillus senegalensis TaxID=1465766 RepID=UPI000289A8D9|nr:hypothetical protein [Paenibacillus senegalensis]